MTDWDWADKIAWYFAGEFDDCTKSDEQIDVAAKLSTALRAAELRGRVAGMREAADLCDEAAMESEGIDGREVLLSAEACILSNATKLESSPTT